MGNCIGWISWPKSTRDAKDIRRQLTKLAAKYNLRPSENPEGPYDRHRETFSVEISGLTLLFGQRQAEERIENFLNAADRLMQGVADVKTGSEYLPA